MFVFLAVYTCGLISTGIQIYAPVRLGILSLENNQYCTLGSYSDGI